jgi:thiosulfate dehydrogenase [quinone] large subunit
MKEWRRKRMNYREEPTKPTPATVGNCPEPRPSVTDDFSLAYALLRATLGVNLQCMESAESWLVSEYLQQHWKSSSQRPHLPHFAVRGFGNALSWAEASVGLLILLGGVTRIALVAGGLLIVLLTFGSALHQDWEIAGLQLIYAMA